MPTETDKFDALVDYMQGVLTNVKAGLNVSKRFSAARTGQKSERDEVMGDPPYYLEVEREGYQPGANSDVSTGDAPYMIPHQYGVRLWLDYEDSAASKTEWDGLVEGSDGLLPNLRQTESIKDGGNTYYLDQPSDVAEPVVSLSNRQPQGELAWYLEFSIIVTHKGD